MGPRASKSIVSSILNLRSCFVRSLVSSAKNSRRTLKSGHFCFYRQAARPCFQKCPDNSAEQEKLLRLIERKDILVDFDLSTEIGYVMELLRRYRNVPMSMADACLVRMSELHADCLVFSTDNDFNIYRRRGDQIIPALIPDS
jgi:hypothetical protein